MPAARRMGFPLWLQLAAPVHALVARQVARRSAVQMSTLTFEPPTHGSETTHVLIGRKEALLSDGAKAVLPDMPDIDGVIPP